MMVTIIIDGISPQHQLHRRISVTSWASLFSLRIRRGGRHFLEGDLQIGFSALYIKSDVLRNAVSVIIGSPQLYHGGCVFELLAWWESTGESSLRSDA